VYGESLVAHLVPGSFNPRKHRNAARQAELEASVRLRGILNAIIIRPKPGAANGECEIVAGESRWRAAKAAGLDRIPTKCYPAMTDDEARSVALIENIQRTDLHPMDEAESFADLMKLDRANTVEVVASKTCKPVAYVKRRLKLLSLPALIRDAFLQDVITPAHAEKIAALPDPLKLDAFRDGCFLPIDRVTVAQALKDKNWDALRGAGLASVAGLQEHIDSLVRYELGDELLQERLPQLAGVMAEAEKTGRSVVQVSGTWQLTPAERKRLGDIVPRDDYREIRTPKDRCASTEQAVLLHGGRPQVLEICRDHACRKHHDFSPVAPAGGPQKPSKAEQQEAARRRQLRAYGQLKGRAMRAMVAQIQKAKLTPRLVKNMLRPHHLKEVSAKFGLDLKADGSNALAIVIANHVIHEAWDRIRFVAIAKLLGFDFRKFEREVATRKKVEQRMGAATPKGARTRRGAKT
jgi:ParB/RepB/Spo0J family partition protein